MTLDRAAREAVQRHDRRLAMNALELAFGKLVAIDGIKKTREVLLEYLRQLELY